MTNHRPPQGPWPRRGVLAALAAGVLALQGGSQARALAGSAPAAGSLPALRRGFNLSHWFEYERGQGLTAAELRGLRQAGLDHVRLPLDPQACGWRPEAAGVLPFLPALRAALQDIADAGLCAVLDLHLEPAFKAEVERQPALEAPLVVLWQALARACAGLPPERLAFQLLNEPQYYGLQAWRWPPLQRRLLAAVRAQAPAHRVLVSGQAGGSLDALLDLVPPDDPALVCTFNHYEPFLFTHQGVHWLDEQYTAAGLVTGLAYPAAVQGRQPLRLARPSAAADREVAQYRAEGWDAARIHRRLAAAGAWSRQHRLPVVCTEFGVYRATADPASRYRWLHDTRLALEQHGLGWTVWDYTDIFGLTTESAQPGRAGARTLDAAAWGALGLNRPGA